MSRTGMTRGGGTGMTSCLTERSYSYVLGHRSIITSLLSKCSSLSSQCVTLGSRNFDNWILWSSYGMTRFYKNNFLIG
ncbi:hypothetical protein [Wolbachia endosymbiont of Folsomia candida]|uniref:hypothetical protein n=1 Tax=Wolbachia endosymbiont of Folsomia candida TaxID=169402 RepID=UPI000A6AC502|nr:hypothetical protein [Wolbachia endosymbiont of Folsomia candida]